MDATPAPENDATEPSDLEAASSTAAEPAATTDAGAVNEAEADSAGTAGGATPDSGATPAEQAESAEPAASAEDPAEVPSEADDPGAAAFAADPSQEPTSEQLTASDAASEGASPESQPEPAETRIPEPVTTQSAEAHATEEPAPTDEGTTAPGGATDEPGATEDAEAAGDETESAAEEDSTEPATGKTSEQPEPDTAEAAEPEATEPDTAAPEGTEATVPDTTEAAEPEVTEPDTPEAAEPEATEPDTAAPEGTEQPAAEAPKKPKKEPKPKKPPGPAPEEVTRRIGKTNEAALRYVHAPDPQLSRLSRKVREALITEVPPVTAAALLGPDALARHFVASAASGRYRDLFSLWELFRSQPDAVKPVLAERQRALERARQALTTAVKLGLRGHAERVAEDVERAQGLIWTWLRNVLVEDLEAVGRRPLVAVALLAREPDLDIPLPAEPPDAWLAEAAAVKQSGRLPEAFDQVLSAHIERLPATVATLNLVSESYPQRVPELLSRVDLDSPEIEAVLAWARHHGAAEQLRRRILEDVDRAAGVGRAEGLARWQTWRDRGVDVDLPGGLRTPTVEGLDLTRPESATLVATLVREGAPIDPQGELDRLAGENRQAAEKAYEAFVCAELDVHLPLALEGNPIVKEGTRCPACQAWTWVRPGHERRCPRLRAEQAQETAEAAGGGE